MDADFLNGSEEEVNVTEILGREKEEGTPRHHWGTRR